MRIIDSFMQCCKCGYCVKMLVKTVKSYVLCLYFYWVLMTRDEGKCSVVGVGENTQIHTHLLWKTSPYFTCIIKPLFLERHKTQKHKTTSIFTESHHRLIPPTIAHIWLNLNSSILFCTPLLFPAGS